MNNGVLMIGMTICNRPLFHWFRKEAAAENDSEHGEYVDDDGDVDSYVDDDDDDSKQMSIMNTVVKPTYIILTLFMVIII